MIALLETGQALYVLMAVCVLSISTRLMTKNLYKRLIKETTNMTMTKNKSLKDLKQKAESAYRMNQGLRDSGAWLEHQLSDFRYIGMTLAGWNNVSNQLTWLCLLLGGAGAFFSYWFRMDTYYVVMYGGGAVLMAMLTMLFDNGTMSGRREQLSASLQDYLENVMCPRLSKSLPDDNVREGASETVRSGTRNLTRLADRAPQTEREIIGKKKGRLTRRDTAKSTTAVTAQAAPDTGNEVDHLKRSLEQIAVSREKARTPDSDWLKNLKPEEVEILGEILKEYLA
ncbi:MAG: hypothetical protein ACRDBO_11050 [Lachnospiraceae bacterium]